MIGGVRAAGRQPAPDIEKIIRGALAPAAGKPKVATALGVGVSTVMRISSAAAA